MKRLVTSCEGCLNKKHDSLKEIIHIGNNAINFEIKLGTYLLFFIVIKNKHFPSLLCFILL